MYFCKVWNEALGKVLDQLEVSAISWYFQRVCTATPCTTSKILVEDIDQPSCRSASRQKACQWSESKAKNQGLGATKPIGQKTEGQSA